MVEQLVYQLETDILGRIAYYLSRGSVASADWQTMKLRDLGLLSYDVQRIINKYRGRILLQTGREVEASADDILRLIRENSPKGKKLVATRTPAMRDIINTWVSSATSKTNIAMATLAQSAGKKYVASVSKASLSVVTGTDTLQKSVMRSIGELEKLDAFVDSAGRTWTPEGYVKMVVRSNQRRVSTETMFQAAREGDANLVEISSHAGARPGCAPYQGRVFWLNTPVDGYDSFYNQTTYGQPDGLLGINCGHIAYPFWEGVSEKTYSPFPSEENKETYEQSQQQRAYERNIRYYKRKEAIARDTVGGEQEAAKWKARVKESQAELRGFIDETGRTRQRDREAIYT